MPASPLVQLQGVTKMVHKKTVIQSLSFDIYRGEILGLLGPNGAGKTTTIRMMLGLISPSTGSIKINGYSIVHEFEQAIQHVGALLEHPYLYKYLTGYQNLLHFARMQKEISKKRIWEIAKTVGLENSLHKKVETYSLGMRQRLSLAQALLHRPSLLILDEPTNGLDPAGIREMRNHLRKLAHDEGMSVLISSHLLSEMEMLCDRIAIMKNGSILDIRNVKDFVVNEGVQPMTVTVEESQLEMAKQIAESLNLQVKLNGQAGQFIIWIEKKEIPCFTQTLIQKGIQLYNMQTTVQSLEDQFLATTKEDSHAITLCK